MRLLRPRIPTDVAVDFLTRQFGDHLAGFRDRPELAHFVAMVEQDHDIAAQKEYRRVTGAGMDECHLAVQVVRATTRR